MNIGFFTSSSARTERECIICTNNVEIGEQYVTVVHRGRGNGSKAYWTQPMHTDCSITYIRNRVENHAEAVEERREARKGQPRGPYIKITDEARRSRNNTLTYLNRDKADLLFAYMQDNEYEQARIMNVIVRHMQILLDNEELGGTRRFRFATGKNGPRLGEYLALDPSVDDKSIAKAQGDYVLVIDALEGSILAKKLKLEQADTPKPKRTVRSRDDVEYESLEMN